MSVSGRGDEAVPGLPAWVAVLAHSEGGVYILGSCLVRRRHAVWSVALQVVTK